MATTPSSRAERASPVDLPPVEGEAEGTPTVLWVGGTIGVATLFLLITNAMALDGWVAEQPPSAAMARISDASAAWLDSTRTLKLATPRDEAHALWKKAQGVRFGGQGEAEK